MRRIVLICLCVLAFQFKAFSSHILGGEITYTHQEDLKYKVLVTIYRDCGECKLAGEGGGPSNKDCGKFFLYLKTSDLAECNDTTFPKIALTRESINQILPFCNSTKSLCESNTGEAFGIEAHTFYAIVDFAKYKSFRSCGFEFFIQTASRANDINNLSGGEQQFYNYAFINPFIIHSSGQFSENPKMILSLNQPVRTMVLGKNERSDSMVVSFGSALKSSDTEVGYSLGYTAEKPLSVYCTTSPCTTNPVITIPTGIYLNNTDGSLIFTPVRNDEKATVVFEIRKWVDTQFGMLLVSLVRRDIQFEVSSLGNRNNPPVLKGTRKMEVCEGQELCFDILAEDEPYRYPDGTYQDENEVTYTWKTNISGATIQQKSMTRAPYNKLSFCWTPDKNDAGKSFDILVTANDDNCPLIASHQTKYTIVVSKRVEPQFQFNKLWCGNVEVKFTAGNGEKLESLAWGVINSSGGKSLKSANTIDTIEFNKPDQYTLFGIADYTNGCSYEFDYDIELLDEDLIDQFGAVTGNRSWCLGDTIELSVNALNGVTLLSNYWMQGEDTLSHNPNLMYVQRSQSETREQFSLWLYGERDGLHCKDHQIIDIDITTGPEVLFNADYGFCNTEISVDLHDLVNIKDGTWKAVDHNMLVDNRLDPSSIIDKSIPNLLCLEYTARDKSNGCESVDTFCVWANPLPELQMVITSVCGSSGFFNLRNMAKKLNSFGEYDIVWEIDGVEVLPIHSNDPSLVKLSSIPLGDHMVVGTLRNEFGCSVTDSAILVMLKDIDLSNVNDQIICQGSAIDLSMLFRVQTSGGVWSCNSNSDAVKDNQLNTAVCGKLILNYTYDRFGCYASSDFNLDIVCEPEVKLLVDDTICGLYTDYELKAIPSDGEFRGDRITLNTLDVTGLVGPYNFDYVINNRGCTFIQPAKTWIASAPTYTIAPNFNKPICEGEAIGIENLSVTNGLVRIHTSLETLEVNDQLRNYVYQPTWGEIKKGSADFLFELVGLGACPVQTTTVNIPINPRAKLTIPLGTYEGCETYTFDPRVIANDNIDWNNTDIVWRFGNGAGESSNINPKHVFRDAGVYSVKLHTQTEEGCAFDKEWTDLIHVFHSPTVDFITTPDGYISIKNPIVAFKNKSEYEGDISFHWDFGTGLLADTSNAVSPAFSFDRDTGRYEGILEGITANGCSDYAVTSVWIGPDIQIFVPSAFSPNGKPPLATEKFKVIGNNVKSYHIEIFNRWGHQVYSSEDINEEWDGMVKSRTCELGVYAYLIRAVSVTGVEYDFKGTLNLLR